MRSIGSFSVVDGAGPTAALSPDEKIAAWTDLRNQRIHLLRLDRHGVEETIPLERAAMGALAFSETGNQLASAGSEYGAVFDVHSKYRVAIYEAPATDILLTSKVGLIVGAFEWTEKGTGPDVF